MAKSEINIFSVSIIDLLAGALGAIIILFVMMRDNPEGVADVEEKQLVCNDSFKEQIDTLRTKVKNIKPNVPVKKYNEITFQIKNVEEEINCFKKIIEELKQIINAKNDTIKEQKKEIATLKNEIIELKEKIKSLENEKDVLSEKLSKCKADAKTIGFKITKKTVFIIDVSGSMVNSSEDRLTQVKAGVKMLIATMGNDYSADVVFFPNEDAKLDYGYKYGFLKLLSKQTKYDIYNFLAGLKADGGTPTEEVMNYVLDTYNDATTIVLLSDGEPDNVNDETQAMDMINRITQRNINKVAINTIGIGEDFRSSKNSTKKFFLQNLSEKNQGFFEGF